MQGGVDILCRWAKDVKTDLAALNEQNTGGFGSASAENEELIQGNQDLFSSMVSYLDLLPVNWEVIRKTKIGKSINSALKAQLFDEVTLDKTKRLVDKWKSMVSELKSQQGNTLVPDEEGSTVIGTSSYNSSANDQSKNYINK